MMATAETFDYIVVGAGSAGCVLAARLSEDARAAVLLLEAGGRDASPWIHVPLGTSRVLTDPKVNWLYESEPEPGLGGRRIFLPGGKVLGGTSSINGMVYIRGHAADYDGWAALGLEGWAFADVLPFFKKAEGQARGADALHGADGPLTVSDQPRDAINDAFLAAATELGLDRTNDFNGPRQDGFGYFQVTIENGRRKSAAAAYLHPIRRRPNLVVRTRAPARRVVLEDGRAVGVEYGIGGAIGVARCRREVIVCGGAFNSPQLLQLSGIGPPELLVRLGIPVVRASPAVGGNLQEHFCAGVSIRSRRPLTLNDLAGSPLRKAAAALRYALTRGGPLATNGILTGGFWRSSDQKPRPDLECVACNWSIASASREETVFEKQSGFTIETEILQPKSRGAVRAQKPAARGCARDPVQLSRSPRRPENYRVRPEDDATSGPHPGLRRLLRRGGPARTGGRQRRRSARLLPRPRRRRVPSGGHVLHGTRRRGRGRRSSAGARSRRLAGRRRLDHADHNLRQHQRSRHHDRRKGGRHDPCGQPMTTAEIESQRSRSAAATGGGTDWVQAPPTTRAVEGALG